VHIQKKATEISLDEVRVLMNAIADVDHTPQTIQDLLDELEASKSPG